MCYCVWTGACLVVGVCASCASCASPFVCRCVCVDLHVDVAPTGCPTTGISIGIVACRRAAGVHSGLFGILSNVGLSLEPLYYNNFQI